MVVVGRWFFGSGGEWIPAKMRRCWSVWIPFFVLNLVLTLSMVSVGSTSNALVFPVRFLVFSPVKVLTEICICGRRRRTSSIRLSWGVDSCEDKALLVSPDTFRCPASCFNIVDGVRRFRFEGDNLPREGLDEDLRAKVRRCWLVWIPSLS